MSDWRLKKGQERYLSGVKLVKVQYSPYKEDWDHDHCEFCEKKFSLTEIDCEKEGWATENKYHWVCVSCYEEFKKRFEWGAQGS